MKNNILLHLELEKESMLALLKLFVPLCLLFFVIREIPAFSRNHFLSKLNAETVGVVDQIEKIMGIDESELGSKLFVKSYHVKYHYKIKGLRFDGSEVIVKKALNVKELSKLSQLEIGDSVLIRYDSKQVRQSKIRLVSKR